MSMRSDARRQISDIITRNCEDRPVSLWHSDISRMTDMLIWLYKDFAKPMVYPLGNSIDLSRAQCEATRIARDGERYFVTVGDCATPLTAISDTKILREILCELLRKESIDMDYWLDMTGGD